MRKSGRFANACRIGLIAACALPLAAAPARADEPPIAPPADAAAVPAGWVWQGVWQDGRWSGQWIPTAAAQGNAPAYLPPAPPGTAPAAPDADTRKMIERCQKYGHDSGTTGGVVGGLAGGVIGNRTVGGVGGTLGGAALGAVAGAAIDHAGKKARDKDCEAFWAAHPEYAPGANRPMSYGPQGYAGAGYAFAPTGYTYVPANYAYAPAAYAYAPAANGTAPMAPMGYMAVPAPNQQAGGCTTTTVTTTEYVDPPRQRLVRAKAHHKDKRVYTGS